jgi:YHS domain-containing protein
MNEADEISGALDEGRVTFERKPQTTVNDPVCGMEVRAESGAASSDYGGERFYFCSEGCKQKFDAHPDLYVIPVQAPHATP